MRTEKDSTPTPPLQMVTGSPCKKAEGLWYFQGKLVLPYARRNENFSETSEDREEFADDGAQFLVSYGKWLEIGS